MRPLSQCMRTVLINTLLGCVFVASSAYGQSTTRDSMTYKERLLTAFGQSELRVQPDLAELRVGVETEASAADQARKENASRTNKVIGAIKALGIPERQIQTSIYQIEPVRRFPPGQQPPTTGLPPIVGYRVRNVVSVRTTNFQLIGRIIDNSIRAGANTVDGVQFMLQDERYIRERALQEAVAEARSNAQAMAKTLGLRLLMIHAVQQGAFWCRFSSGFLSCISRRSSNADYAWRDNCKCISYCDLCNKMNHCFQDMETRCAYEYGRVTHRTK